MAARIDICNRAIARLPASPIQSFDENSLEARECRRYYPLVVSKMLEGDHDWSFANRRVELSLAGSNEREDEWLFAYTVPTDMGSPIRVIPDLGGLGYTLPIPLPGEPYAETWASTLLGLESAYIIENGVIYTNTASATLEYGIDAIEEVVIGALAEDALAADLASYLAVPVKKDRKLRGELMQEAEALWQRAIADDANRYPRQHGGYVSEGMAARAGWLARLPA